MTAAMLMPFVSAAAQDGPTEDVDRSTLDGVFSEPQASRGRSSYRRECGSCHGVDLRGGEIAPPLVGKRFFRAWIDRPLSELFENIRESMPQDRPGSLSRRAYAEILAYMLQANRYPSGTVDLVDEREGLQRILIRGRPRP